MNASGHNRIVVDWDDTCVQGAWPEMGDWLPGAADALRHLLGLRFEVVILSTRLAPFDVDEQTPRGADQEREVAKVRAMLDDAGLAGVGIWTKPWKPGAVAYIDDKAVRFNGDWAAVLARFDGETILEEAQRLVYGDRQSSYGHPADDFERTAAIWSAILGVPVSAKQASLCMVGVKISRECNAPKRDNLTDGAGYFAVAARIEARARGEE